jgi:glycosyltransferase involved in cell wall biosynthesis
MEATTTSSKQTATRRMRILHVVPTYYPAVRYGGPIRSVHGLAAALAARGHDVHVYTTSVDGDRDLDVPDGQAVDLNGVSVHYFRVPALRRLYWSPVLRRALRKTVGSFDIVHLHSVFLWPMWAAARQAARAGVPYFVAPRGMLIRDMIQRKNRWLKAAWISLIERETFIGAAGVHSTAELEREELLSFGWPLSEIALIANGVDIPAIHSPRAAGPFARLPASYVLFLSRISWKKGLDRLLTAWQEVPDLTLVIAGNDDEGYLPQLQALAKSLGVSDRVLFAGAVSDEHKWGLYADAELLVLPSYSENFGNVVAEAMAMSCPVVVSPEVGIARFVDAHGAGVVSECSPGALASSIRDLMGDRSRREQMGRRGAAAVRAQLSWEAVAHEMESFYVRAGNKRSASSVPVVS